jgi:hypothetical protein
VEEEVGEDNIVAVVVAVAALLNLVDTFCERDAEK